MKKKTVADGIRALRPRVEFGSRQNKTKWITDLTD